MADAKATAGASRPGSLSAAQRRAGCPKPFFRHRRASATRAARAVPIEIALEPADQILEIVGLARQFGRRAGARPPRASSMLGLLLLPLLDQQRQPQALVGQPSEVAVQALALVGDVLAHARKLAQDRPTSALCLAAASPAAPRRASWRSAATCSASSGRTRRAGGGWSADPLQRRQHLADDAAPVVERFAQIACSRSSSGWSRSSVCAIAASTARTRAAASISCWLSLRRSSPIDSMSRLSLASFSSARRCRLRSAVELLVALLERVQRTGSLEAGPASLALSPWRSARSTAAAPGAAPEVSHERGALAGSPARRAHSQIGDFAGLKLRL